MPKCEHCGKEVILPYKCGFCGHYFCVEHRLPENHNCPDLSFRFQREEKVEEQKIEKERIASEGELHFVKESTEKHGAEEPKPKGKLKYIVSIFCILLILVGYASYSFGYNTGSNASFNTGYDLGYAQGYINGNLTGFELGYRNGNSSGYLLGYQYGNITGYELGYLDGNSSGYIEGYNKGYLDGVKDGAGTGYNIRDPTYQEMLNFIASDKTDENEYSENYTCLHFTADVKSHAFDEGYKCGFVYVEFRDGAHAIVCFNTTDQGLIFIEPQSDEIVTLTIGQPYWDRTKYEPPDYDDTVISFTIIW
ncbi:MAG: AN1-type zinc finger domain-containing protein [Candidatus Bathyarchaeia archaeon]